ncbi:MAG: hypothetical protein OXF44_05600 [Anaerolineaceae bacterium]|nr:hypothetical protein [Anaerolineaceae bacterium]
MAARKEEGLSDGRGIFFMVVGPPGAGKNTLMNDALRRLSWLKHLATCTTRSPRPGEAEAGEYHFVSMPRFRQMIANDELLEWQEVHPGRYYGVPRLAVERGLAAGESLIADLDVLGATCLQMLYPENSVLIFIEPPSARELTLRMQGRGDREADIQSRIRRVRMEMQYVALADEVIVNDDLASSRDRLCNILQERRERRRSNRGGFRDRRYMARLLVMEGDRALLRTEGAPLPWRPLRRPETPHEAALRCLADLPWNARGCLHNPLGHAGSFLPPTLVEALPSAEGQELHFTWVFRLDDAPAAAPAGWRWTSLQDPELPAGLAQQLNVGEALMSP